MSMSIGTVYEAANQTTFASALKTGFRSQWPILFILIVYFAFHLTFLPFEPAVFLSSLAAITLFGTMMMVFSIALLRIAIVIGTMRPDQPIKVIALDIWRITTDRSRLACGLPILAYSLPFFVIFGEFKAAISKFSGGFPWDETFSNIDRWMHLGHFPWQ